MTCFARWKHLLCLLLTISLATTVLCRGVVQTDILAEDELDKGRLIAVATNVKSSVSLEAGSTNNLVQRQAAIDPTDICFTEGCTLAAAKVIERMNQTVDPCEDFYQFSCGGFVSNTAIPDEKTSYGSFNRVDDKLKQKLRILIEEKATPTDTRPTKMVKDLYSSCMNQSQVDKLGLNPLRELLKKLGGWPVVEKNWNGAFFQSWIQSNYRFRKLGLSVDYIFDFSVTSDVKNSTRRIIWMDQASLGMSREYLMKGIKDSDVQAYLKYCTDLAILLGAEPIEAKKQMTDVLLFQIKLANISLPREERRNTTKLYNLYTLSKLAETVPDIPWVEYINTILPDKVSVNSSEVVGVSDINYFTNLTEILKGTSNELLANYLVLRAVASTATFLTDDIRDIQLEYSKTLTGQKIRQPRWKECQGIVSGRLSYALSSLYVKRYFNDNAKAQAEELVSYVRQEFRRVLTATEWMDPTTKVFALKKADDMKSYIAYPDELKDDKILDKHYKNMTVDSGSLLNNVLRLGEYGTSYAFGKLREGVNKTDWKRRGPNAAVVNAYYSSLQNAFLFPAGILAGIFFDPERPKAMNFGGIGFVIGHEITHGFDDQGRQFDADGNLVNWWDKMTESAFLEKAKCIIYQYGNYTAAENGLNLNGINTQGENIADNGGLKQAYRAYQKWVAKNGPEKRLPGIPEFSPNQLFWISSAQVWCSKYRPQSLKLRILTGVHSPGQFRVQGPLSNSKEFAKDWNCPVNSKMNPSKKCEVWQ